MTLALFEGSGFESSRLCSFEELAVFSFAVYLYLPGTVFREEFGQFRYIISGVWALSWREGRLG